MRAPLAVCGNAVIDVIDGGSPRLGGGPYHCGHGLRLLERPSQIFAKCASADRPVVVPALAALGLPVTIVEGGTTASCGLDYEGESRRTSLLAIGDPWRPTDVADVDARWVHVAPIARSDFPAETLAELARDRRVSYDGQGLVRAAEVGPVRLDAAYDPAVLTHLAFLKLAEEEAAVILPDLGEAAVFGLGVPEVVVTLGSQGSIVYTHGTSTPVPCHPVHDVELTGCGDAFAVGYLAARSDGLVPVAAARRATALVAVLLESRKRQRRNSPRATTTAAPPTSMRSSTSADPSTRA
jgi:sugar/nucleoside kinase (ribokinase family)